MISFETRQDFTQAAFDRVAEIVSQHGQQILECSIPAFETEKCLEHLLLVASRWAYDPTKIDTYYQMYVNSNQEIIDYFGE